MRVELFPAHVAIDGPPTQSSQLTHQLMECLLGLHNSAGIADR